MLQPTTTRATCAATSGRACLICGGCPGPLLERPYESGTLTFSASSRCFFFAMLTVYPFSVSKKASMKPCATGAVSALPYPRSFPTRLATPVASGEEPGSVGRNLPSRQGIHSASFQNPLTSPTPAPSSSRGCNCCPLRCSRSWPVITRLELATKYSLCRMCGAPKPAEHKSTPPTEYPAASKSAETVLNQARPSLLLTCSPKMFRGAHSLMR